MSARVLDMHVAIYQRKLLLLCTYCWINWP